MFESSFKYDFSWEIFIQFSTFHILKTLESWKFFKRNVSFHVSFPYVCYYIIKFSTKFYSRDSLTKFSWTFSSCKRDVKLKYYGNEKRGKKFAQQTQDMWAKSAWERKSDVCNASLSLFSCNFANFMQFSLLSTCLLMFILYNVNVLLCRTEAKALFYLHSTQELFSSYFPRQIQVKAK